MSRIAARLLYWSPRILSILFAMFLSLFALDVFREVHGFWPTVLAFAIHLVPAIVVIAVLLAAWRWEWIGTAVFSLAAVGYAVSVLPQHMDWAFVISLPLLVIAALFLTSWIERPKLRPAIHPV